MASKMDVAPDPGLKSNMVGALLTPVQRERGLFGCRPAAPATSWDSNVVEPGGARSTGRVPRVGLTWVTILKSTGNPQGKGIEDGRMLGLPDEVAYSLLARPLKMEIEVPKQYEVRALASPL